MILSGSAVRTLWLAVCDISQLHMHQWQRFFSTFPRGGAGVGLLILRSAVGLTVGLEGVFYVSAGRGTATGAALVAVLLMLGGGALLLGWMTPVAAVLAGAAAAGIRLSWLVAPSPDLLDTTTTTVLIVAVAIAVILLGPGAVSLDARIFGRREVIIPHRIRPGA